MKGISFRFLEKKKEIFVRVTLWLHDVCDNISIQCCFRYYFFVFLKFDVFFFIFSKIFILISKYKTNSLYRIFIVSIKREKKKFSVNSLINWYISFYSVLINRVWILLVKFLLFFFLLVQECMTQIIRWRVNRKNSMLIYFTKKRNLYSYINKHIMKRENKRKKKL